MAGPPRLPVDVHRGFPYLPMRARDGDGGQRMTDDVINLIARVLAWESGHAPSRIADVASDVLYQDAAQQCAEDLGIAP